MRFARDQIDSGYTIQAYGQGQVTINDEVVTSSVVVTPARLLREWEPERFDDLAPAHLEALAELEPEIVVLGTGGRLRFPAAAVTASLAARGIGVEVMDTAAACRTYNILVSEDRNVVAALLMI